ncbi:MAG TPA: cell wall-binding repeat-containing protein [Solirubrobacteraceae bacterium]|nr:cell wall-binding repeat-containing protein [Solirubrobacteraceae bacterium]
MSIASVRATALAVALCTAIAGCGKTLSSRTIEAGSGPVAVVGSHGAGGLSTKNTTRLGGSESSVDAAAVAVTVYPGLTPATRPQAVVLVDGSDWPAALAASVLAGSPLHAPLLYSERAGVPEVSSQALRAMAPTGTGALGPTATGPGGRAQVIQIGAVAAPTGYVTRSVADSGPASLAVDIERLSSLLHHHSPHQLIVTAADGPPAMTMPAAGLAAQTGAPILFVERAGIPRPTSDELAQLGHSSIYVVGPPSVVSSSVVRKLERFGRVTRIGGPDPASNAIAVARFTDGSFGWGVEEPGHGLVFANASRPFDAPAAAPLSAIGDYGPLLLLESPSGLPSALSSYLSDLQPGSPPSGPVHGVYNHGWLIGDESAISAQTQATLDSILEISSHATVEPPIASATNPSTPSTEPTQTSGP